MLRVIKRRWAGPISRLGVALVMAGGVAGLAGPGTAQAAACSAWQGVLPENPVGGDGIDLLNGVAVVSACSAWVVGEYAPGGTMPDPGRTLIEQWTGGGNWTVVPSPDPGSDSNELEAVSAVSASDVWAVGSYFNDDGSRGGLAVRWNGSSWAQVTVPGTTDLAAVTAVSASDVWAAGHNHSGNLLLHYDGTSWTQSPGPPPGGFIAGLSATSGSDVWAVGQDPLGNPLSMHWDGTAWSQVPVPAVTPPDDGLGAELLSVSASGPADAWAVGSSDESTHTLTLHWDGNSWTKVDSPDPAGPQDRLNELGGVVAVSPGRAYAVGDYAGDSASQSLVLRWDGHAWAQVPSGNPGSAENRLKAVAIGPGGIVWVAGSWTNKLFSDLRTAAYEYGIVPDVVGLSRAAAFDAMNAAGVGAAAIDVTTPTSACTQATNGNVVSVSPAAGALASFPATLAVCSLPAPPPPVTKTVPNVFGAPDSSARAAITAAGLTVGSVTREANCAFPNATVWLQSPSGGTQVAPGSPVNLKEATGRQDNGRLCPPTGG